MIPDEYWQLARRWLWLIVVFVVLGAISAPYVLPTLIGSKPSSTFHSTATLSVSHYVSAGGLITPGGREVEDDVVAGYTESLALYAETPQFFADVQTDMEELGLTLHRRAAEAALEITADPILFRVVVRASNDDRDLARALVQAAADVLIARALADEGVTTERLAADLEEEQLALVARLDALAAPADPATTPSLLVDVERTVIKEELRELTLEKERLLANRKDPLSVVSGPDTVQSEASIVPTRDLVLLGIALGLVLGWLAANVGEHLRPRRRRAAPTVAREMAVVSAPAIATRMHLVAPRPSDVAHQPRRLAEASPEPRDEPQERA